MDLADVQRNWDSILASRIACIVIRLALFALGLIATSVRVAENTLLPFSFKIQSIVFQVALSQTNIIKSEQSLASTAQILARVAKVRHYA
jgi:hypothetical protein